MMRYLLLIITSLLLTELHGQDYGQTWIDYQRPYFKVKVAEDGVYRLSAQLLQEAGIPASSIPVGEYRLYSREREEPIYVDDQGGDGFLNGPDAIEFWGQANDGRLDSLMYTDPGHMVNPHYSLINDSIYYYLTWTPDEEGRRFEEVTPDGVDALPDLGSFRYTSRASFVENYNYGRLLSFDNTPTEYVEGEGWTSTRFGLGTSNLNRAVVLPTTNASSTGPPASGQTVFASANNPSGGDPFNHHIRVFRGDNDQVQLADLLFTGYQRRAVNFEIPASQIEAETRVNHVVIDDLDLPTDNFRIGFTELEYSHTTQVDDLDFIQGRVSSSPDDVAQHLRIRGASEAVGYALVRGPQPYRLLADMQGDTLDMRLPDQNEDVDARLFIPKQSQVFTIQTMERVGDSGFFTDFSSWSPDSAFVIITHASLRTAAETYAVYRTNAERDAVVVDVEELYDQYGGGIPKHPYAIRRFCRMAYENWPSTPAQLFLIGKSVYLDFDGQQVGSRRSEEHYAQNLLPSYGSPGSDLLFTVDFDGSTVIPEIPVGRLSALSEQEVIDYLAKVVSNESSEPAAWMKNVLHFGGGNTQAEQAQFAGYLSNYETIIEDTCFGGNVSTFLKESSLPIVVNLSDSISEIIEEGVSILTFFGHAGGGQFDQSIDAPGNLDWGGHPMVLVNSCYSGDIHLLDHSSTSEEYVILPEKGAIGFLATIKQGLAGFLNGYSQEMYRQISYKNYGKPMGELMKSTIENIGGDFQNPELRNGILMNTLQGDPAVIIFSPELPDYQVQASSVRFDPPVVTAVVDSFDVVLELTNVGKAVNEAFSVEVIRQRPDGAEESFALTLDRLLFRDTVRFRMPTDFADALGVNAFTIRVDLPSNVVNEEDNFFNNTTSAQLLISDGGVFPVKPFEFAVVPESTVELKASTGAPFIEERDYRIQLDTTDSFDSASLLEHTLSQAGGVLEWTPSITLQDSTVYYWRVSEEVADEADRQWRLSSFQYIPDRTGWGQAHFEQFASNNYNNLIFDRPERDFDYFSGEKNIRVEVYGEEWDVNQSVEYFIDFESQDYNGFGVNNAEAFHVAVIDPVTLEPWGTRFGGENPENFFGNLNDNGAGRQRVEYFFAFRNGNAAQMEGFRNMVLNEVPDGHILLIYTWLHARPEFLDINLPDFADIFNGLGAPQIASIEEDLPFIYIGVKGDISTVVEVVGDTATSYIEAEYFAPVTGNQGQMRSRRIGPANAWGSAHWSADDFDPSDSVRVRIRPISANGQVDPLPEGDFLYSELEVLNLDELVDANQYPYLQLEAFTRDPVELDPVQWDRWHVLYEPVPEAALDAHIGFLSSPDSLQEGQTFRFATAIHNISDLPMDSLLVHYWIQTADNERIDIPYARQDSLRPGEVLLDTIEWSTVGLSGANSFWVEVNPRDIGTGEYDQLEQFHFNNLGQLRFHVGEDRLNPLLDVTFDGRHILDGDLVSARPEILIRLDDENPYLLMDDPADTSFFSVFLRGPDGDQRRLRFGDIGEESMTFYPADNAKNVSEILLRPDLAQDGQYQLLVLAADKSGNASGNVDYRIAFEVESQASITEVLNYPNPFTTSTRFVFTLTGSKVPDFMKIEIMTITGSIVKEIFKEDLGNIHIGRNITDYAWDGTDDFGDRLANGVYLYRVVTQDAGEDLEQRQTAASTFFKKGFGKMYLMR